MNCPNCSKQLKKVKVNIAGAKTKAVSLQCSSCDYFSFEKDSSEKILKELRSPLRIRQKVIKLSGDRLGIYFSNDVVRSLGIEKGEYLYLSAPDENHIVLERE